MSAVHDPRTLSSPDDNDDNGRRRRLDEEIAALKQQIGPLEARLRSLLALKKTEAKRQKTDAEREELYAVADDNGHLAASVFGFELPAEIVALVLDYCSEGIVGLSVTCRAANALCQMHAPALYAARYGQRNAVATLVHAMRARARISAVIALLDNLKDTD
eukprot:TRINITY_DN2512_c0_g1_i1.p1 TRINITY_DN2512_c0_g1~~TRINITY_DN2512_c0_g1_i1.p1  ORF type:complete len:161 (-),score=42.11 TRINITY_DN2512_c0_g1_i1:236-718(-)